MDIIADRRPFPLLLTLVIVHLVFGLGAWYSTTGITEAIYTLKGLTDGKGLVPKAGFALELIWFFALPVLAVLHVALTPQAKWLTGKMTYSYPGLLGLGLAVVMLSLLVLTHKDPSLFGLVFTFCFGMLVGMHLKAVLATALCLSLGASLTLLTYAVHGSFFAVIFGLMFQNCLLFGQLAGACIQQTLAQKT